MNRFIPRVWFLAFGRGFGILLYWLGPRKRITRINLMKALGCGEDDPLLEKAVKNCYRFWGMFLFDMFYLRGVSPERARKLFVIDYEGAEELIGEKKNRENAVVFFISHYSNPMAYAFLALEFENVHGFIKKQNSPWFTERLRGFLGQFGMGVIVGRSSSKKPLIQAYKALKSKGILMIVGDQSVSESKYFSPFFGTLAPMPAGLAKLPAYGKGEAYFSSVILREDLVYEFRFRKMPFPHGESEAEQLKIMSATYNRFLEETIGEDPSQYLWMHKRWKKSPGNFYGS